MPKLWIVHRQARRRNALAHLAGLPPGEIEAGAPTSAVFAGAASPDALLLGLEDDFELELDFLHRHRAALAGVPRLFLVRPEEVDEAMRLTGAGPDEIVTAPPDPRRLRAFVLSARVHRRAEPLAARRDRERITRRFSTWFGALDLPGLMRALDPRLADWPLLVRGVPGSGRSLAARYVERERAKSLPGPTLRIDARTVSDLDALDERRRKREALARQPITTIWIDALDALAPPVQCGLADWIRFGVGPDGSSPTDLRWVATAGPPGFEDRLEPALLEAFAPLIIVLPALADHPEALGSFVERVVGEWTARTGGPPRSLSDEALEVLEAHAWVGDRAAVEALLHSALATTARRTILASDLAAIPEDEPARDGSSAVEAETEHEDGSSAVEAETEHEDGSPIVEAETGDEADLLEAAFLEGLEPAESDAPESDDYADASSAPESDDSADASSAPESDDSAGASRGELPPEGDLSSDLTSESFRIAASEGTSDAASGDPRWRRLARSLSHEIRNPLVSIKTFTELLPEHFEDDSFRERFTELVGRDVAHIDEVIGRLARAAEGDTSRPAAVDVSAMIERLLDERRETIGRRRLLVLRELEREAPLAWAEPNALESALAGLIDRALASLPERGDLFIATRHIERGPDGAPRLRVLLRHHHPELGGGDRSGVADVGAATNAIEYVLAETVVESVGGQLTIDTTDTHETLILVDLRTPA